MTLVKWTPRPMTMFDEMNDMMTSIFNNNWNTTSDMRSSWSPAVDVKETKESYMITADIPGLRKSDIHVDLSDGVLSISGDRVQEKEGDSDRYHYRERTKGTFARSFHLPESVNEKKIAASFKDGILAIDLPKLKPVEPRSRKIKIS